MTLDLHDLHLDASPSQGSQVNTASAWHFILWDGELMTLARPDHEVALAADDLASDGIIKESVLQTIDDKTFKMIKGLTNLSVFGALEG